MRGKIYQPSALCLAPSNLCPSPVLAVAEDDVAGPVLQHRINRLHVQDPARQFRSAPAVTKKNGLVGKREIGLGNASGPASAMPYCLCTKAHWPSMARAASRADTASARSAGLPLAISARPRLIWIRALPGRRNGGTVGGRGVAWPGQRKQDITAEFMEIGVIGMPGDKLVQAIGGGTQIAAAKIGDGFHGLRLTRPARCHAPWRERVADFPSRR